MNNSKHEPILEHNVYHPRSGKCGRATCQEGQTFHVRNIEGKTEKFPIKELLSYSFVEDLVRYELKEKENKTNPTSKEILEYARLHPEIFPTSE